MSDKTDLAIVHTDSGPVHDTVTDEYRLFQGGVFLLHGAACLAAYPVANHPGKDDADDEAGHHDNPPR